MVRLILYKVWDQFLTFPWPAKRRAPPPAEPAAPKARQSKLAKEHGITAQEENEIKEAFVMFSQPYEGEKDGVIPISDVRKAMMCVHAKPTFHGALLATYIC